MKERVATLAVLAVRYLFLTRYSWLVGLVLIGFTPISLRVLPGMLGNLFVLDVPWQVYHVSWIALWCAVAVMDTLRVTTVNAPSRFDDYRASVELFRAAWGFHGRESRREWYRRREGLFCFAIGLTTAVAIWYVIIDGCITSTAADPAPSWERFVAESGPHASVTSVSWHQALLGLLTTMAILCGVNGAVIIWQEWMRRREERAAPTRDAASRDAKGGTKRKGLRWRWPLLRAIHFLLGPGYFRKRPADEEGDDESLQLATGHVGLLTFTAVFLTWYAVNYCSATGSQPMPVETSSYPAIFFGLLSLLVLAYVLPGCAFYFDRYRIPATLVFVLGTLGLYSLFGTDHYYELQPKPEKSSSQPPRSLADVYDEWQLPGGKDGKRTLVVVHASGGGIQASAWSAQVLTGLHERYGSPFSRSIGLISAVSGGSVGTMYYLLHRADMHQVFPKGSTGKEVLDEKSVAAIRELSRASALEATAWGIAYPDTMRAVCPPFVKDTIDRGWAMERVWRQRMSAVRFSADDLGELRLAELGPLSTHNQLPVVVFNATLVETGQRLLISPVLSPPPAAGDKNAAVELMRVFPSANPRVSTAARLSATFPYVTPAARAGAPGDLLPPAGDNLAAQVATYHVVDGGYADNEGAVTSVDWINRLLIYYSRDDKVLQRPFDHVLLVRIQAFPKQKGTTASRATSAVAGWRSALVGPLDAMMKVRIASQTERGDLEVDLLTQATTAAINAAKERFEAEFKLSQARADALQLAADSQEAWLKILAEQGSVSESEATRRMLEARDRVASAEAMVGEVARKRERISTLTVASVLFDFQPAKEVGIPLSWKLTSKQKQHIDAAWEQVVSTGPSHPALSVIESHFYQVREPRNPAYATAR